MAETRKITVNGEVLTYTRRRFLHETLQFEDAIGMAYGQWEAGLVTGSARALCAFVWDALAQNGRDVPLQDVLSGAYEIDLATLEFGAWQDGEAEPGDSGGG